MNKQYIAITAQIVLLILLNFSVSLAATINIDFCRFKAEDEHTYLELYIEIPRIALVHTEEEDGWEATVTFNVDINSDSVILAQDKWKINDIAENPKDINSLQKIIDIRIYMLPPGQYNLSITATDKQSGHIWKDSLNVEISSFPKDELTTSDIELANHLLPPGIIEKYDRDGFALVPTPNLTFGQDRPFFFYYIEIYPPVALCQVLTPGTTKEITDTTKVTPDTTGGVLEFTANRFILNNSQDTIVTLPATSFSNETNSFADVDSVSLEGLTNGFYTFVIQLQNNSGDTTTQNKSFIIYDSKSQHHDIPFDSLEVEIELDEIRFLLEKKQIKLIKKMAIGEKALFLREFWRRLDDDPASPEVPVRLEFRERIREADRLWDNSRMTGHKTDRGRIFILHGEPDDREVHTLEINTKPYEIWIYDNIEGGVIYVFVDRNGQGEYIQVHSTKQGETRFPNWYDFYVARSGSNPRR
ncbi:MAG: GWxTD domain-containing protein [Candidatus Hatepunaea meridiana]|nr:GWxTD domain-containing protein [Candidatus Hatepunaea meridiana]